jgi:hypothetical protein
VQFHLETYSLNTKRLVLLSDELSKGLPEVHDKETRTNEERKLGAEFPVFNDILVIRAFLDPWLNNGVTGETHESLNGEEYQET